MKETILTWMAQHKYEEGRNFLIISGRFHLMLNTGGNIVSPVAFLSSNSNNCYYHERGQDFVSTPRLIFEFKEPL